MIGIVIFDRSSITEDILIKARNAFFFGGGLLGGFYLLSKFEQWRTNDYEDEDNEEGEGYKIIMTLRDAKQFIKEIEEEPLKARDRLKKVVYEDEEHVE